MRIVELMDGVHTIDEQLVRTSGEMTIEDLVYDSRNADTGKLFVALTGMDTDGHHYVMKAYEKGVRFFVVEKDVNLPEDTYVYRVNNSRAALSRMSANLFGHPSRDMTIVGVTGTKGKTTVSHYIRDLLESDSKPCGLIGTVGVFYGDVMEETVNTTPESYELQRILRRMRDQGIHHVVMEVSSGGLMMNRVEDIRFRYGIYLNLTPDHIGEKEHPTFEHYRDSKAKLFKMADISIINADDAHAEHMKSYVTGELRTFSLKHEADYTAMDIREGETVRDMGTQFTVVAGEQKVPMFLPYPGLYNVYNALASISVAAEMGLSMVSIKEALPKVKVPGRFQIMNDLEGVVGILDYAHNKVALLNLLETVRAYKPRRIILVIGSVGNRTKERRHELAEVASLLCDVTILTEDNQDREDPWQIAHEMAGYMKGGASQIFVEADRKKAIALAVSLAETGDAVILAGKGHETYNLVFGKKVPYSDEQAYKDAVVHKGR